LLRSARAVWKDATLLCITHDVNETRDFERVIVLEHGRIVEDGAPLALEATLDSRYRALLRAETALRSGFWADGAWRRLRMRHGNLVEG
jgi:ATP-binding cassette subfamily B protein